MRQGKLLGHVVSSGGLMTDPEKMRVIEEMQTPTNVSAVRSLLGHVGYYRRFLNNGSKIAHPPESLLRKGIDV